MSRYTNPFACSPTPAPCAHVQRCRIQIPLIPQPASLPAGLTLLLTTRIDADSAPRHGIGAHTPCATSQVSARAVSNTTVPSVHLRANIRRTVSTCYSQHMNAPQTQNRNHRTSLSTYTARAIEAPTTGTIAACETLSTLVYTLVLYTTCAQMYKICTWVRT